MDKKLYILQGISGSGKSTLARVLAVKYENAIIVSRDDIREKILGKRGLEEYFASGLNLEIEREVTKREHLAIATGLAAGKTVIIDNTNLKQKYVTEYCKLALDSTLNPRSDVILQRLDTVSVDEALKRVQERGERLVSRDVIQRQYDSLQGAHWTLDDCFFDLERQGYEQRKWYLPHFDVTPYEADKTKPLAVICDIDGTLAHRALLMDPTPHYRSFYDYQTARTDDVDEFVKRTLLGLASQGIRILFVSGRKSSGREATMQFLERALGSDFEYELYMRDESRDLTERGLDASDNLVKYRIFNEYIRADFNVLGVLDDRKRVVALWETLGLRVMNVGLLNEEF